MKTETKIELLILAIDQAINCQVNRIIHHDGFQQLEASWRSLYALTHSKGMRSNTFIKIKILDINFDEISKDVFNSSEFYQTTLYETIYTQEYDHPGGEPFGIIVIDFSFHYGADHINIIKELANIASESFCSFILHASPKFLDIDTFCELKPNQDLDKVFSESQYKQWRLLRKTHNSKFICFLIPRVLARQPYQKSDRYLQNCYFREEIENYNDLLWSTSGYLFASLIIRSFSERKWFNHINDYSYTINKGKFLDNESNNFLQGTLDIEITDHMEQQLNHFGMMTIRADKFSIGIGCCYSHSIYLPHRNNKPSTSLQNTLCVSRFAHYIKVIMRDKIGGFYHAKHCESYLQNWLLQYTASQPNLPNNINYSYPLQQSRIRINQQLNNSGHYICSLKLTPRIMINNIETEFKFKTRIQFTPDRRDS